MVARINLTIPPLQDPASKESFVDSLLALLLPFSAFH
jgi:hypothetical protein